MRRVLSTTPPPLLPSLCDAFRAPPSGKVHGSLARAGKVKGQTPKVPKLDKKKKAVKGRAKKRVAYNRRYVNVVMGPNGKVRLLRLLVFALGNRCSRALQRAGLPQHPSLSLCPFLCALAFSPPPYSAWAPTARRSAWRLRPPVPPLQPPPRHDRRQAAVWGSGRFSRGGSSVLRKLSTCVSRPAPVRAPV